MSMEKNQKIILVVGGLITLGLFFIEPVFALIALSLVLALLVIFHIMGETGDYPFVTADLSEDAREIIVTNVGTAMAQNIHVALVPLNIDFEIASLDPDEESRFGLAAMIPEAKAVVTYENADGRRFQRSYPLTALGANDPTKPLFPLFGDR